MASPAENAATVKEGLGYDPRELHTAALAALLAQAEAGEERPGRVPSHEGGPGKEETYWLRRKLDSAILHLRDIEDYYRVREGELGSPDQIRADRARWIYERITEDFVNGKTTVPTIGEAEADRDAAVRERDQAREDARRRLDLGYRLRDDLLDAREALREIEGKARAGISAAKGAA